MDFMGNYVEMRRKNHKKGKAHRKQVPLLKNVAGKVTDNKYWVTVKKGAHVQRRFSSFSSFLLDCV